MKSSVVVRSQTVQIGKEGNWRRKLVNYQLQGEAVLDGIPVSAPLVKSCCGSAKGTVLEPRKGKV
jgi:hypothetical protein